MYSIIEVCHYSFVNTVEKVMVVTDIHSQLFSLSL